VKKELFAQVQETTLKGLHSPVAIMVSTGTIFMPIPTPQQKVSQVAMFGGDKGDHQIGW
jgi:hypothetical protein